MYHIVTYLQKHESLIYSAHCDKMEYREHIATLKYIQDFLKYETKKSLINLLSWLLSGSVINGFILSVMFSFYMQEQEIAKRYSFSIFILELL